MFFASNQFIIQILCYTSNCLWSCGTNNMVQHMDEKGHDFGIGTRISVEPSTNAILFSLSPDWVGMSYTMCNVYWGRSPPQFKVLDLIRNSWRSGDMQFIAFWLLLSYSSILETKIHLVSEHLLSKRSTLPPLQQQYLISAANVIRWSNLAQQWCNKLSSLCPTILAMVRPF